jgi:hypothetical protein
MAIPAVNEALRSGNLSDARRALFDHLNRRIGKKWPEFPDQITDLDIRLSDLSGETLIRKADDLLAGNLSPDRVPPVRRDDGQIDWERNPTAKNAWIRRLNRHAWWAVLVRAWRETGDRRYADGLLEQWRDWVGFNPPPPRRDDHSPAWRLMDVGLRLRTAWVPAYGALFGSGRMTDADRLDFLRSIFDHCRFLASFQTNRNHLLRETNGLLFAALSFPEFGESESWKRTALERLDRELERQVFPDGFHIEVSTGYQWLVADEFESAFRLMRDHGLELPRMDFGDRLAAMYEVLAAVVRPDGSFPELNDGYLHWPLDRLAQVGERLGRADFRFAGTRGREGRPPAWTSRAFGDAGLYVMREGWFPEAGYLVFDAGPHGGPHGHEDRLSVELAVFGIPFLVDSGTFTYDRGNPYRPYFLSSEAHNTGLVDGFGQLRRWDPLHAEPRVNQSISRGTFAGNEALDFAEGKYEEGYGPLSLRPDRNAATIRDVVHSRRVLYVRSRYWLILDRMEGEIPHEYEFLFHAHPDVEAILETPDRARLAGSEGGAAITLDFWSDAPFAVRCHRGDEGDRRSWFSPGFEQKRASSVLSVRLGRRRSIVLATLIAPWKGNADRLSASLAPLDAAGAAGSGWEVRFPGYRDAVFMEPGKDGVFFGGRRSAADIAVFRENAAGETAAPLELDIR